MRWTTDNLEKGLAFAHETGAIQRWGWDPDKADTAWLEFPGGRQIEMRRAELRGFVRGFRMGWGAYRDKREG